MYLNKASIKKNSPGKSFQIDCQIPRGQYWTHKILTKLNGLSKLYTHIYIYYVHMFVYTLKIIIKDEIMNFGRGTRKVGGNSGVELIFNLGKNINYVWGGHGEIIVFSFTIGRE